MHAWLLLEAAGGVGGGGDHQPADLLKTFLSDTRGWAGDGDSRDSVSVTIKQRRGHAVDAFEVLAAIQRITTGADALDFDEELAPARDRVSGKFFKANGPQDMVEILFGQESEHRFARRATVDRRTRAEINDI